MEISGKKLSDQDRTYCQPCYEEGENITADAFCTVCKEFLCSTCINEHRALKATKRHTFLDRKSMPTSMTDICVVDDSNVPCDIHPKEFIKYFCPTHETSGLGIVSQDQTLAVNSGLGIISKEQTQRKQTVPIDLTSLRLTAAQSVPVRSPTDTKDCRLTGMLLLPDDRLLLADHKNSSVKLFDLQISSMISQIKLPGAPWGMCVLPADKVAVCLYDKSSVVFLDTRGQITVRTSIKVDGKCYDIVHHNDQLFVSFDGGKIVKMDMKGNIIKRVDIVYGQALFTSCLDMTLMDDSQKAAILVSDYFNHTVIKLDIELNILQTIKDPSMQQPRGIIAVGNQLLLCSNGSHKIMRLDLSTGKMIHLLGESDGIQHPHSVGYSPEQNKLYITSYAYRKNDLDNNVQVYKAL